MVSLTKASSILFAASSISSHVANAHTLPKDFDAAAFAIRLKKFRADAKIKEAKTKASGKLRLTQGKAMKDTPTKDGKSMKSTDTPAAPAAAGLDPSRIGNPNGGGTTAETFLDGHEFIAKQEGDDRGPCPYINCMANHGFINRSGQGVPAFDIAQLAMILFDLPDTMFPPVVNMAIFAGQVDIQEDGAALIDIERLWSRPAEERDASMVFPNPGLALTPEVLFIPESTGFEPGNADTFTYFRYQVDEVLLQKLLARSTDGVLTIADHQDHLRERIMDSVLHDVFFNFSEESFAVAANQYLFPIMLMGDQLDDFTSLSTDTIENFWREFRFPDGFAPRSVRFGDDFDVAAFNQVRADWQAANIVIAEEAFEEGKRELKNEKGQEVSPAFEDGTGQSGQSGHSEDGTPPSADLSTM